MSDGSHNVSDLLEDDLDPEEEEECLGIPQRVSTLVNSPTSDTLDSVALEPSPTDDEIEIEDKSDTAEDKQDHITFVADQELLDEDEKVNTSSDPKAQLVCDNPDEALSNLSDCFSSVIVDDTNTSAEQVANQSSLSSYFDGPQSSIVDTSGSSFFDTITNSENSPGLEQPSESFYDNLSSIAEDTSQSQFDSVIHNIDDVDSGQKSHSVSSSIPIVVDTSNKSAFDTVLSTSQPESISFEGETVISQDNGIDTQPQEMLSKDGFESFTAQGSELVSDFSGDTTYPIDQTQIGVDGSNETTKPQPSTADPSSLHPGYHPSLHQGPSVGTTPTQLSPLSTPVHQLGGTSLPTQLSPGSTVYQQPPFFDRQTSVPSVPSSPFHQCDNSNLASAFTPFSDNSTLDDPFTASLCMSDSDRRYDAWIPSDATRHTLITMAMSPVGSYTPAPEQLSYPHVLNSEPQGDPVKDLVYRYMGEQEAIKRQVLNVASVSQDVNGLQRLIECGCLRAAVDLTGILLSETSSGEVSSQVPQHFPSTLQMWFCRLSLLVKLKLYDLADSEFRAFQTLDTPDVYFEFYPQLYPGRKGSMVPFGMRLLHAELPSFNGRSQEALDRLYYVLAVTNKIIKNLESGLAEDGSCVELSNESRRLSLELWRVRENQVLYKIAGVLLTIKDYEAALTIYETLMEKDASKRDALQTGMGRIYLQMGNITNACAIFKEVESDTEKGDNSGSCRNAINRGMVSMCQNNFSEAYDHFKSAVQVEPNNTCAVNNMSVCSLYLGRLKDALNTLESLIHNDPANNLYEGVLFNLCTLYELESSRALHKKQTMLDLVSRHKGDGFPIQCLKMP